MRVKYSQKRYRYKLSAEGLRSFPEHRGQKAWGRVSVLNPDYIQIQWDGHRTAGVWATAFFQRVHQSQERSK
jgi:hypothetical protein